MTSGIEVLKAIEADSTLCALQVHSVEDGESGFRAATFVSDATSETVIIFKGTSTASEWMDNLDIVNDYSFIVSGHFKGDNLARYAVLFTTDTLIDKCLAFDGQCLSQKICESEEYRDAIERNGQNLYMIASDCDYVNVLFKSAVDWSHKMYLESNPVVKNKLGTGFLQIACYKLHKHYEVEAERRQV